MRNAAASATPWAPTTRVFTPVFDGPPGRLRPSRRAMRRPYACDTPELPNKMPGVVSHPGANREFQFPYSAESKASSSPRLVGAWWRKSVVRSSNLPWRATSEYAIGAECRSFRDKRHQAASPVLTSRPTLWHQPCQNRSDQGGSGRVADVVDPTRMTPNRTFTR